MPRFTIGRMMLAVGAIAVVLAIWRAFGPDAFVVLAFSMTMTGIAWLVVRHRPRLAAWAFAATALLVNVSVAMVCAYLYSLGGIVLLFLILTLIVPMVLGCCAAWARADVISRRLPRPAAWSVVL